MDADVADDLVFGGVMDWVVPRADLLGKCLCVRDRRWFCVEVDREPM